MLRDFINEIEANIPYCVFFWSTMGLFCKIEKKKKEWERGRKRAKYIFILCGGCVWLFKPFINNSIHRGYHLWGLWLENKIFLHTQCVCVFVAFELICPVGFCLHCEHNENNIPCIYMWLLIILCLSFVETWTFAIVVIHHLGVPLNFEENFPLILVLLGGFEFEMKKCN